MRLLLAVVLLGPPAAATDPGDVAVALRSSPVYAAPGVDLVDPAALAGVLGGADPQVDVVALPADDATTDAQAADRAAAVVQALDDPQAVVLVLAEGGRLGIAAGSGARGRGVDAPAALAAERQEVGDPEDPAAVTGFVQDLVQRVADQASGDGAAGIVDVPLASRTPSPTPLPKASRSASRRASPRGTGLLVLGGGLAAMAAGAVALRRVSTARRARGGPRGG
ncbi:MAG: hypothetical protein ACXVFV_02430 [Mycobacteriales bacterium]